MAKFVPTKCAKERRDCHRNADLMRGRKVVASIDGNISLCMFCKLCELSLSMLMVFSQINNHVSPVATQYPYIVNLAMLLSTRFCYGFGIP